MVDINNISYFPILKTTDAELKAFENLDKVVRENIIPVFELTRSRKSKKNMNRCISKRIEMLKGLVGSSPFILDLTMEKQLSNEQIDSILDDYSGGFPSWVKLVKENKDAGLNIIPVIHYDEQNLDDVKKEIEELFKLSDILAFRVSVNDAVEYIKQISAMGIPLGNLIVILDAEYQEPRGQPDKSWLFADAIDAIIKEFSGNMPKYIACAFSSFPDAVAKFGEDDKGGWLRYEKFTYQSMKSKYANVVGLNLKHSDYSSVHPYRYDTTGGQWIPRIDFPNNTHMIYYRSRRDDGGYPHVAKLVLNDPNYSKIKGISAWGDVEIFTAGTSTPNGGAPSHWISVRINLYITRTLLELIS